MVSVNSNPPQPFYLFDPSNMPFSVNSMPPPPTPSSSSTTSNNGTSLPEEQCKGKIRKPYTITKCRESWTDQEHEKFLEALQLFDRDWKKIEAFVGSKTVIQIRSHAQKYFMKVQKKGTSEHVPPPRPKRKATHPYPQKAPKSAPVVSQVAGPYETPSVLLKHGYGYPTDSSFALGTPFTSSSLSSWSFSSVTPVTTSQITKDDGRLAGTTAAQTSFYSSSNESNSTTMQKEETVGCVGHNQPGRVLPDFAQVYKFIGSVFDPDASGHLERLKQMDPINLETALLLMRNLSINLTSPEFENHRKVLLSYDPDCEHGKPDRNTNFSFHGKSKNAILSA